jgi:uncharacterized membrane protein HdeD (DUF308 family)
MAELTAPTHSTDLRIRWQWLLALGVVLLLLGLASAGATTLLEITSLLVFGPLLLASSLVQFLIGFIARSGAGRFLQFVAAGLEAMMGFLIMANPFVLLADLVTVIAAFLTVIGVVRMARSLVTHSPGRAWAFMAGVGALILGIFVGLQLPVSGLWFVGLGIALDFLCHGASWTVVALAEGKTLEAP